MWLAEEGWSAIMRDGRSACEVNLRSCHQGVREVKLCFEKARAFNQQEKRNQHSRNARKNMAGSGASEELSLPIPVLKIVEGTEVKIPPALASCFVIMILLTNSCWRIKTNLLQNGLLFLCQSRLLF